MHGPKSLAADQPPRCAPLPSNAPPSASRSLPVFGCAPPEAKASGPSISLEEAESNLLQGGYPVSPWPTQLPAWEGVIVLSSAKAWRRGTCYQVCTMLRRLLAVGPFLVLAFACASPTLPLPPPEEPTIGAG